VGEDDGAFKRVVQVLGKSSIVGLGFSKDDFIRKDDDVSQWITNKRLSSTLKEWELVARECGPQQRQSHAHSISNLIYGVTGLITRLVTSDSLGGNATTSFFANEPSTPVDTLLFRANPHLTLRVAPNPRHT